MRWFKWIGVIAALSLFVACFYPWVVIESKNFIIRGTDAKVIHLGSPAYFHFLMIFFFLLFTFTPKVWAKRSNLLVVALNIGWAVRNYFVITGCQGGECPEKQIAIYIVIIAPALMLLSSMFPDIKLKIKN